MPLYEYQCRGCHHQFELLVREQTVLECPECHSTELEKQLSVFAVGASAPKSASRSAARPELSRGAPGPCGTCGHPDGPGSCSIN